MTAIFDGKVAIVTGAGSGIGREAAIAFGREGASVIVSDVNPAGARETVRLIAEEGGEATCVRADVSLWSDVEDMVTIAIDRYGRLDYAFNNAGIGGESALTADYSEAAWDRLMSINLKGLWLCMKAEMAPIGRLGRAEEIADAVTWICSDRSSFVTGHELLADGGWVAR